MSEGKPGLGTSFENLTEGLESFESFWYQNPT